MFIRPLTAPPSSLLGRSARTFAASTSVFAPFASWLLRKSERKSTAVGYQLVVDAYGAEGSDICSDDASVKTVGRWTTAVDRLSIVTPRQTGDRLRC